MNFFPSELTSTDGQMTVDTGAFQLNVPAQYQPKLKSFGKSSVILGLRPEDMYDRNWAPNLPELSPARMKVDVVEHLGNEMFAYLIAGNHSPTARLDSRTDVSAGDTIDLVLDASRIHAFDPATQEALF
jgi:multiple sugar transport system ATP-binding protein